MAKKALYLTTPNKLNDSEFIFLNPPFQLIVSNPFLVRPVEHTNIVSNASYQTMSNLTPQRDSCMAIFKIHAFCSPMVLNF